ncbi:hypothetical protein ACH4Q7_14745 [Streptomyces roseolus]|uniref:hypothetical protein n=1 Tax=Streptomyces roseolus TaxID=67358 RepID=UPI0037AB60EE
MTAISTEGLDPLYDPARDGTPNTLPVDIAQSLARKAVAQYADADVHSHHAMIEAAVTLGLRLRSLLAALDAEEGQAL